MYADCWHTEKDYQTRLAEAKWAHTRTEKNSALYTVRMQNSQTYTGQKSEKTAQVKFNEQYANAKNLEWREIYNLL